MKKFILKWIYRITAINNRKVLLRVANLPASGTVRITKDEEKLLKDMIKYCRPSQVATRNGKAVYRLRDVEGITLWSMLETRRAEDANGRIKAWTDDNYEAETILDAAKLDKFIVSQMEIADGLEQIVFQNMKQTGESALTRRLNKRRTFSDLCRLPPSFSTVALRTQSKSTTRTLCWLSPNVTTR